MTRVPNLFFCSLPQNALLFLWPRPHPNGAGLTQRVRRLSVVSTNMGRVLIYSPFLTGQPPFWGAASLSSTPAHFASFRVSVGSLDVRAQSSWHSQHFLLIRETVVLAFFLVACCSLCEVGVAWPGDVRV